MSFNFMAAVTICSDFEPKKIKSVTVTIVFQSIYHEVTGPDAMILVFSMLSFKPTFSCSLFTFIRRLFSSSSLSAKRMVSSAYLRLLIFLPAVLIPPCASSCPVFQRGCTGAGGLRGATPCSRSGRVAVRRYPSSKVRSRGCALLEQP